MVSVQLRKSWSDQQGRSHEPGTMIDVDVATLAQLQANGVVEEFAANGGGGEDSGGGGEEGDGGWVDPSDDDTDGGWVDPSSEDSK